MDKKLMYVGAGIIFMGFLFGLIPSQGGNGTTTTTYTYTQSNTATTMTLTPTTKTVTVTYTTVNPTLGSTVTETSVTTKVIPSTITQVATQVVPTTITTTVKQIETTVLTYITAVTQTFGQQIFTTATFTQNIYSGNVILINANDFGGWNEVVVSGSDPLKYTWIPITGKPSGRATITVSTIELPRPDYVISMGGTYTHPELSFKGTTILSVVADSSGRVILDNVNVKEGYLVYPSNYLETGVASKINKVYPRIKISGVSANGTLTKINGTPDEFEVRPGVTQLNVLLDTNPVTMNPRLAAQSIWGGGGSGSYISMSTIVIGSIVLVYAGLKKGRVDG